LIIKFNIWYFSGFIARWR